MHESLARVNPTSAECYALQGPGIGAGPTALEYFEERTGVVVTPNDVCLDIGFGDGTLLEALITKRGCKSVFGVDIAHACAETPLAKYPQAALTFCDVSHEAMPLHSDSVDIAFCTEMIEHLTNPYFMMANAKRVLRHGGYFVLAFPMPEDNLGYEGGQHAHVYPGFLQRESLQRFMRQLYFKQIMHWENGSSGWYVFRNYKGDGIVDVFEIVSGNYTEDRLFACLDAAFN